MSEQFIVMFDDTDVSKLPAGPFAYAGYVGGRWPTFPELERLFPGHYLLDIAVNSSEDARCLDIENGDATIADAPAWVQRQLDRGVFQPVLYISASGIAELDAVMSAAGIGRADWLLWSAHYTDVEHLCHVQTCGFSLFQADATQWTSNARGISLDQSIVQAHFFAKPSTQGDNLMNLLPVLATAEDVKARGLVGAVSKDAPGGVYFVYRAQALVRIIAQINNIAGAKDLVLDGDYGPATKDAVEAVQHHWALTEDGITGPATWALLVTGWHG